MRKIIARPEGPLNGFIQGAGWTAAALGPILVVRILFMGAPAGRLWVALGISFAMTFVSAFLAGAGLALWRLVQGWAYDRFTSGDF